MIDMAKVANVKSAEIGGVPSFGVDRPKSDWKKTIPEIVKIIRANPELFTSLKNISEELSLTQNLFLLSKGEEKLIESELELSGLKVDSLQWKKTREKLHNACEKTADYDFKRRELMEKLLIDFTLNYCAVFGGNYNLAPYGEDRVKIKKEFENDGRVIKMDRLITDLHLWNENYLVLKTMESGKMVREKINKIE